MSLQSIQSYCGQINFAGNTHIKCVPVEWVEDYPEFVSEEHNYQNAITLKAGKQWLVVPCAVDSIDFKEDENESAQGKLMLSSISGFIPQDTPQVTSVTNSMRAKNWVVVIQYKTGEAKTIGTPITPARFTSSFKNDGKLSGSKGYAIKFTSASSIKSFFVEAPAMPINPNCQDAEIEINGQFTVLAPSGQTTPLTFVNNIGTTLILTDNGNDVFEVPNGAIAVTDEDGTPLATFPISPAMTEPYTALSGDIQINGNTETAVLSGGEPNIITKDQGGNVLSPAIASAGGRDLELTFTVASGSYPSVGATLMKTGQTTSYATGDDGDIQAGREADFFTLHGAPKMADGSPTIHTSDKRFTDELGGQNYANEIMIDWSTFDNQTNTVLGWDIIAVGAFVDFVTSLANAASHTKAGFSNWRLPNINQAMSIYWVESTQRLSYTPLNIVSVNIWTSNSFDSTYGIALASVGNGILYRYNKSSGRNSLYCRVFTVNGTNPLT